MSGGGDAQAIVEAARMGAEPTVLNPEQRYAFVNADGGVTVVDRAPDALLHAPRRVSGTTCLADVDSLVLQWQKYSTPGRSEAYADPNAYAVTAVLNGDASPGDPGFRDHRLVMQLELSPEWKAWSAISGTLMPQTDFASFLEDRSVDVEDPAQAEVLDLVQHFEASSRVDFKSAEVLSSGQRSLVYEETVAAKAGQKGDITIPTHLSLILRPFEGREPYRIRARFRYRISGGSLALGVTLERPEDVLKAAFDDVVAAVSMGFELPVLVGVPPAPVVRG